MNPGLVVKLRPSGPWRIGPDSGARNRVDVIYHSDSLYSAVTSAMARLGWLEEWLDATARNGTPAVSFSSCFPYLGEHVFVVPPRTIWPPAATSARAASVRWKSARFVPLTVVQSILAGRRLEENQWTVDGPSDCLVPAGGHGPFRTAVRWSAGVDRLTGASERHSTACIEFRAGSGLWTVVSFPDEAAGTLWSGKVKAAFRLLADTGFGGERSRGWGRSEAPEFIEGMLPGLILPALVESAAAAIEPDVAEAVVVAPPVVMEMRAESPAKAAAAGADPPAPIGEPPTDPEPSPDQLPPAGEPEPPDQLPPPGEPEPPISDPPAEPDTPPDQLAAIGGAEPPVPAAAAEPEQASTPSGPEPPVSESPVEPVSPPPGAAPPSAAQAHWLLSLFTPASADTVDWQRGNYIVLARGGRVDSPAGSGELKKQIQMVAEGSVLYADAAPRGSAANVAPDGFAHPVFRAGFALAIPLPEVR